MAKKSQYDPAADLLENVLKRRNYSGETHEAVTNWLARFAASGESPPPPAPKPEPVDLDAAAMKAGNIVNLLDTQIKKLDLMKDEIIKLRKEIPND